MSNNENRHEPDRSDPDYLDAVAEEFLKRAFPNGLPTGPDSPPYTPSSVPFIPLEKDWMPETALRPVSLPILGGSPRPTLAPPPSSIPEEKSAAPAVTSKRATVTAPAQRRAIKLEVRRDTQRAGTAENQAGATVQGVAENGTSVANQVHAQSTQDSTQVSNSRRERSQKPIKQRHQHTKRARKKTEMQDKEGGMKDSEAHPALGTSPDHGRFLNPTGSDTTGSDDIFRDQDDFIHL